MCLSKKIAKVFSFKNTPPGNNLIKSKVSIIRPLPLALDLCQVCGHLQLSHVVNASLLFQNNYTYISGATKTFLTHFDKFSSYMIKKFKIKAKSKILDICSNDGYFLNFFKKKKMCVLGVEPSKKIFKIANKKKINTINNFFSTKLAHKIANNYGKFDLITSHNVFAHIDDLDNIFNGINLLLKKNGVLIVEVGYFLKMYQNKFFDTIYHEHTDYHTVRPFLFFLKRFNLDLFDVEVISVQGGSLRLFIKNKNNTSIKKNLKRINSIIKIERKYKISNLNNLKNFFTEISNNGKELKKLLIKIKKQGSKIIGYGAPTKATTFITHFQIGKIIDYIVEDNPLKVGYLMPINNIPIKSSSVLQKEKKAYILILAWNFFEEIIKKQKNKISKKIKFIVPFPKIKII